MKDTTSTTLCNMKSMIEYSFVEDITDQHGVPRSRDSPDLAVASAVISSPPVASDPVRLLKARAHPSASV